MAKVKAGYRLHVVDREGVLLGTVHLDGYDHDWRTDREALAADVLSMLPKEAFEAQLTLESKTEEG